MIIKTCWIDTASSIWNHIVRAANMWAADVRAYTNVRASADVGSYVRATDVVPAIILLSQMLFNEWFTLLDFHFDFFVF